MLVACVVGLLGGSSCASNPWCAITRGSARRSVSVGPAGAAGAPPCFHLTFDATQQSRADATRIEQAFAHVCTVFRDPRFRARIEAQCPWYARSVTTWTAPAEVANTVLAPRPTPFLVFASDRFRPRTLAVTCAADGPRCPGAPGIALSLHRVRQWTDGVDPVADALLVETVAHELTHLLLAPPGARLEHGPPYEDGAQARDGRSVSHFVSYQVGNLARCHFLEVRSGAGFSFDACLAHARSQNPQN